MSLGSLGLNYEFCFLNQLDFSYPIPAFFMYFRTYLVQKSFLRSFCENLPESFFIG